MMATISEMYGNGRTKSGTVEDITSEFTSSNTRVTITSAVRSGNVIQMQVGILRSSAISSGGSVTATLTSPYLPAIPAGGIGYLSACTITCSLTPKGAFTFRNSSDSEIAASSGNYAYVYMTYITG